VLQRRPGFVAFGADAENLVSWDSNGHTDIFVRDRPKKRTRLVSVRGSGIQSNAFSSDPEISASGRFVTFTSEADTLEAIDSNGANDVFVRDRKKHRTRLVSISSGGLQGNAASSSPVISAD
jgi:Tol biopolymer transport system component